ncbi:MotA/TolQ/ExbB proton channel family protein [Thioalkalivibrio sp.]|uniref:MotA/TolQ/ExbB proton channel family protein n=1 Tax=Thioalkalivibrio sp. TaxID=2093813 RepID=UPI003975B5DF
MTEPNILYVFYHGDIVLIGVFLILLVLSIVTWAIAATKGLSLMETRRANRRFLRTFWEAGSASSLREAVLSGRGPLAEMAREGWQAMETYPGRHDTSPKGEQRLDDHMIRTIRQSLDRQQLRLQAGQTFLASVGSLAPFIGLFGTVWGIHNALIELSILQSVSMDLVAGPLGEALVATAAGLAAAIPAVAFYNVFNRFNRLLQQDFEAFAHDLHAFLMHSDQAPRSRGSRVDVQPLPASDTRPSAEGV